MYHTFRFALTLGATFVTLPFLAASELPKQALLNNGTLIYQTQKHVETFGQMFTQANTYGRLRSNNFYFYYDNPDSSHVDQLIGSVGGSLVLHSANYKGFDTQLGFYYTHAFFQMNEENFASFKAGKDTFSRFEYANNGSKSLTVLGQANLGYHVYDSSLRVGRQLVETFYTKSNDTKMIPNTFDGAVFKTKALSNTQLTLAYLQKQKLRDHKDAHAPFMVGDATLDGSVIKPSWSQNDDSAMLKGLTYSKLQQAGKPTDAPLIVLDATNKSLQNTKVHIASYLVPSLLSQAMVEADYKIQMKNATLIPAFRYIHQFDLGAGDIASASLTPLPIGSTAYKNPNSLNADMIAMRLVTKFSDYKLNLAYTNILDKADLVTPWRGFPTAGYTRSMGMYNWKANTQSYRIELVKGANKKGIYTKPFIQTSILYIHGDAKKSSTAQSMLYYAGIIQNIPSFQNLQYRVRFAYRDFIQSSSSTSDYIDARAELNYLF